jgi:hypothetical protein
MLAGVSTTAGIAADIVVDAGCVEEPVYSFEYRALFVRA